MKTALSRGWVYLYGRFSLFTYIIVIISYYSSTKATNSVINSSSKIDTEDMYFATLTLGNQNSSFDPNAKIRKLSGEFKFIEPRIGKACIRVFESHRTAPGKCYNKNGILNTSTIDNIFANKATKDISWTIFRYPVNFLQDLLRILEQSVQMIPIDDHVEEMYDFIRDYHTHSHSRQDMFLNQHSPELWFPYLLEHHPRTSKLLHKQTTSSQPPLFYFVSSHVFTFTVYVLHENKFFGNPTYYWEKFLPSIIQLPEWQRCSGLDFIIPATHPVTPLNINDKSTELNILAHASFLVVDNDMKSRYPKDPIIPYFVDSPLARDEELLTASRNILVAFAATSRQSVRGRIFQQFSTIVQHEPDVLIQEKMKSVSEYYQMLRNATFCMVVRGDTTSSSRLFAAIAYGCIPVIISDWILMPYQQLIDYTKFSIQIEESFIMNHPEDFLVFLRNISSAAIASLRQGLAQARQALLYDGLQELNPASLSFLENLIHRIIFCVDILGNPNAPIHSYRQYKSSMCNRLRIRIQHTLEVDIFQLYGKLVRGRVNDF
jgi:hypothetical protein